MKLLSHLTLILVLVLFSVTSIKAEGDPDNSFLKKGNKDKLYKDYKNAKKEFNYKTGKPIDFYIDFQVGAGSTSANVTSAPGVGEYGTKSSLGFTTGALFYLSLFDLFSFSSGISLDGKSFKVTPPIVVNPLNTQSYVPSNYLNIPLNFNYGGKLSEKVGLTFNGGPYIGILMSKPEDNTGLGYKNFDLGLNATLTGNYVIAYPLSIILGTKFMYG